MVFQFHLPPLPARLLRDRASVWAKIAFLTLGFSCGHGWPCRAEISRELRKAVQQDDAAGVARLLDTAPADQRDTVSASALIWSAYDGRLDLLDLLFRRRVPANAADERGWNALLAAVKGDQLATVDALLAHGADPDARPKDGGSSAFMLATELGRRAFVERMQASRASKSGSVGGDTGQTLATAVQTADLNTIRTLLADPAFRVNGFLGQGALLTAIKQNDVATATGLLDRGADADGPVVPPAIPRPKTDQYGRIIGTINIHHLPSDADSPYAWIGQRGTTPLIAAVESNNAEMVRMLLVHGADLNRADLWGATPLDAAVLNHAGKLALDLLRQGAALTPHDRQSNFPLFCAIGFKMPALVEPLLAAGLNVDQAGEEGVTPLMHALARCHEAVDPLLARHARLDLRNHEGQTVFDLPDGAWLADKLRRAGAGSPVDAVLSAAHQTPAQLAEAMVAAVKDGDAPKVKSLLDQGADPAACNKLGWPVSVLAASLGHTEVLRVLNDRSHDIVFQDAPGRWTPLLEAAGNGHLETVRFLLACHAEPNLGDRFGNSPLDYAVQRGYPKVAEVLRAAVNPAGASPGLPSATPATP